MREQIEEAIADAVREASNANIPIPRDFDEAAYLVENADVAKAVSAGELESGYKHYVTHGRHEGRRRTTVLT